tara:strand:- start:2126 stop:2818 length:693 start_codon:yes stop_codon:yes gene_type:complete
MNDKKIIVALDSNNIEELIALIKKVKNELFAVKIGYQFFLNFGFEGYKKIQDMDIKIFLDLKLHDIPNTINYAVEAISKLNPYFTTIHISGGDEMQKITNINKKNVKILGVTILTSLDKLQTKKYYSSNNINETVSKFVGYAIQNKLDGIVCSPLEIEMVNNIKSMINNQFLIVTPGIRTEKYKVDDDQKRSMTPKQAIKLGADYLVIGRPITKSKDPLKEIISINSEID